MSATHLTIQSEVELLTGNIMDDIIKNTPLPMKRTGHDGVFLLEDVLAQYGIDDSKNIATEQTVQFLREVFQATIIFKRKDGTNNISGTVGLVKKLENDEQRRFTFSKQQWFEWDMNGNAVAQGWGAEELLNHLNQDESVSQAEFNRYMDFIDNVVYPDKHEGVFRGSYVPADEIQKLNKQDIGEVLTESLQSMPDAEKMVENYEAVAYLGVQGFLDYAINTGEPFRVLRLPGGKLKLNDVEFDEEHLLAYQRNVESMLTRIFPKVVGKPFGVAEKMVLFTQLGDFYRQQQQDNALKTVESIMEEANELQSDGRVLDMPDEDAATSLNWLNWDTNDFFKYNLNDCTFSALQGSYQSAVLVREFLYYLGRELQPVEVGERVFSYDWTDKRNPTVRAQFRSQNGVVQTEFGLTDSARVKYADQDMSLTGFALQALSESPIAEYRKFPAKKLKNILEQAAKSTILFNFPKEIVLSTISGLVRVNGDRYRSKTHEILVRENGFWQDYRQQDAVDEEGKPFNKHSTIDLFRHVTGLSRKEAAKKLFSIIEGNTEVELSLSELQKMRSDDEKSREEKFALNYPTLLDKVKNKNELGVYREYFTQERGLPNYLFDELYGKYLSAGFYDKTQSAIYGREVPPKEEQSMVLVFTPNDPGFRFGAVRSIHLDARGNRVPSAEAVKQNLPGANAGIGSFSIPADLERYQTRASQNEEMRIAFVEAPLDAISYHSLFPCDTVFSQNGLDTSGLTNTLQTMFDYAIEGQHGLKIIYACDNTNEIGKDKNGDPLLNEKGTPYFDDSSQKQLTKLYKKMHMFCADSFVRGYGAEWDGSVESFIEKVSDKPFEPEHIERARRIFSQALGDGVQKLGAAVFYLHYQSNGLFEVKSPEHPVYGRVKDWNDLIKNAYEIEKKKQPEFSNVEIHEKIKVEMAKHDENPLVRTVEGDVWFKEIVNREKHQIVELKGSTLDLGFADL